MKIHKLLILSTVMVALVCASLYGQEAGTISGRVIDPQQAVIPAVKVSLRNNDTALSRETVTGPDGIYSFQNVASGVYTVTTEANGFKKEIAPAVRVEVAARIQLDFELQIGAVADTVEVFAAPPQLQTSDSQIGGVVETKAIVELPLNGRNFTQLMVLMPGSTERSSGTAAGHYVERGTGTAFSVNGMRQTQNMYLIDGFMAKEVQDGTNSVEPIIDALQEFRVQSANYTAEFGTEAGGQINAVLKSGTNAFHGSAWEFLRNDAMDANNFFNNRSAVPIAEFRRNQFGVTAGGPVVLPKYNGKNRTFIFGGYEGTRLRKGITQTTTVPDANLRNGIFPAAVNDPLAGAPFANNTIPASRQNSITTTILNKWVPLPNTSGVFNYISANPQALTQDQFDWRIDHRISDKDSVFGHYIYEDNNFLLPKLFPTDGASQKVRGQNGMGAWTHLFGASMMNDFRLGYSRFSENEFQARAGKENVVSELGMKGLCETPTCWGIPQQIVTGFAQFGEHGGQAVSGPRGWRNEFYSVSDSMYKTVKAHQIKFGGNYRRHRDNFPEAIQPRGQYSYTGLFSGQPFGDYLLGIPYNTVTSIDIFSPHLRNSYFDLWVQDDWRITSELTLNLGMRYEWAGRPSSDDGSISSVVFKSDGAHVVTGRDPQGLPTSLAYNANKNFAPRVGLAYSPKVFHGKTVFRAAYGIFYQRELANTWIDLAINAPFIRNSSVFLDTNPTSPYYFRNFNLATPTAIGPAAAPLPYYIADPDWKDGLVHQWNFNIQQAIGRGVVLQAAYVGNHGTHLPWELFPNQPAPGPGTVQTRRPYPNFSTLYLLATNGDSHYHGLQVSLEKRYSNGMQFMVGYTYAKCISDSDSTFVGESTSIQNGRDATQQRGLCSQDFRQRLTVSYLFDLPFGKGRHFLTTMPRAGELILGGWQFNGIYTARTGAPFTATQSGDAPNVGDGSARPNLVGDPNDVANRSIDSWFNTAAFAVADRFTWGSEGRNVITGPGINNWDVSLFKNFQFDEKRRLQFRAEFFNAFNRAEFALPGATIATAQFGKISGTARDPRDVQFSLKFLW